MNNNPNIRNEMTIDFVVTWLDSSDPEWQKSYSYYSPHSKGDKGSARFRNLDLFRFWFRAIELYAPWVNKVFLVTNGKFPDWINPDHPKLILVRHEDFMPKECLPTFNSCAIELHMNKIKGLSEHFVYFNDDIFLNSTVSPNYFFKNGLPCDINKETCFNVPIYTPEDRFGINISMLADISIINAHFRRWNTVRQSIKRWLGPHLGFKGLLMSLLLSRQRLFIGFSNYHTEQAFLKSIFNDVWENEPDFLNASCSRFREEITANPYIFRYWQFAKNMFYPLKRNSAYFSLTGSNIIKEIKRTLSNSQILSVCLNDTSLCSDSDYLYIKTELSILFQKKFSHKSSFEV